MGGNQMILYLLQVSMNVDNTPLENLIIIILALVIVAIIIIFHGIHIKLKESEINIGGMSRQFARRDNDVLQKEKLKKYSDDIDHEMMSNLFDLVEEIEEHFEHPLVQGQHCYFTFEKFSSILRNELYRRIRRNNLWEKITDAGKDLYISNIIRDVKIRYEALQANAKTVKCCDNYADFSDIKNYIRITLNKYFDRTAEILIAGYKKKIKKYEETKGEFKTVTARKICCDDCIARNQMRIDKLQILLSGRA